MTSDQNTSRTALPDHELVRLSLKSNREAQKALFYRFSGKMMTVCRRYARDHQEAQDFLQEAFIRVFKYLHQFEDQGSLEGWIRRTVVNAILRCIQIRNRYNYEELTPEHNEINISENVIDDLENEEILLLINQLPEGYKIIFNLYVIEGYNHKEIGQLLNISESTSRSQLVRAKKSLRKAFVRLNKITVNYHGSI